MRTDDKFSLIVTVRTATAVRLTRTATSRDQIPHINIAIGETRGVTRVARTTSTFTHQENV